MAAENIGVLVPTKIPGYADPADIQAALRVYHYGSYSYDPANTSTASLVNPSIAWTLNDMQEQIDGISLGGIPASILDAKGDLISASGNDTPIKLSSGTNNQVLIVNTATASGLQWSSSLTGLTLTSPLIDGSGIVFEGATADSFETTLTVVDPTADRTVTIPNESGTLALRDLTINPQTSTTYLIATNLSDNGRLITLNNASGITVTVPTNASAAYPIGSQINLAQIGAGQVTVAGTSGVTVNGTPGLKLRTQYSLATLIKIGNDSWLLTGDLSA
jgi:hypothetical protein